MLLGRPLTLCLSLTHQIRLTTMAARLTHQAPQPASVQRPSQSTQPYTKPASQRAWISPPLPPLTWSLSAATASRTASWSRPISCSASRVPSSSERNAAAAAEAARERSWAASSSWARGTAAEAARKGTGGVGCSMPKHRPCVNAGATAGMLTVALCPAQMCSRLLNTTGTTPYTRRRWLTQ